MVNPIPDGYHVVTPYLCVDGAADAIEFYKDIFGAVETVRMAQPDGRVGHAELQFGDSVVMLSDEVPEMGVVGPKTLGGTPFTLHVYVDDSDRTFSTRWLLDRPRSNPWRTGSTAIARVSSSTRGATSGTSRRTWRTSTPRRCSAGPQRRCRADRPRHAHRSVSARPSVRSESARSTASTNRQLSIPASLAPSTCPGESSTK